MKKLSLPGSDTRARLRTGHGGGHELRPLLLARPGRADQEAPVGRGKPPASRRQSDPQLQSRLQRRRPQRGRNAVPGGRGGEGQAERVRQGPDQPADQGRGVELSEPVRLEGGEAEVGQVGADAGAGGRGHQGHGQRQFEPLQRVKRQGQDLGDHEGGARCPGPAVEGRDRAAKEHDPGELEAEAGGPGHVPETGGGVQEAVRRREQGGGHRV